MSTLSPRFWVAVVSREHVLRGRDGGFIQVCHGKRGPLSRMAPGDLLTFYSPVERFEEKTPCRRFTALVRMVSDAVYEFDMGTGFVPYRRDVEYLEATEAPIEPLIPALGFIRDKRRWGFPFRRGLFEVSASDWAQIVAAMGRPELQ